MAAKINVYTKKPGQPVRHVNISSSSEALQKYVDGYPEIVSVAGGRTNVVIICNDEGKLIGLPPCAVINGTLFVGNIIMAGLDRKGLLTDCPFNFETAKQMMQEVQK